jgi:hypothetical protein
VIICVGPGRPHVRDAGDCGRFHVESTLGPADLDPALRAASAGHGADDGDAWISIDWVRSEAGAAAPGSLGTDWPVRFDAMVDYARSKGWLDGPGTHVRAHVVRAPDANSS